MSKSWKVDCTTGESNNGRVCGQHLLVSTISALHGVDCSEESSCRTLPDFGALNTDDIALFAVDGTELMGKRARAEGATEALIVMCSKLNMMWRGCMESVEIIKAMPRSTVSRCATSRALFFNGRSVRPRKALTSEFDFGMLN